MKAAATIDPFVTQRVFDSECIRVKFVDLPSSRSRVVVTFASVSRRQSLDLPGFGEEFLKKLNIPALHVLSSRNDWYQNEDIHPALDKITSISSKFGQTITYGSSMGGYASALFSKKLGAEKIVSISPQFSIDRLKVPFERRWLDEASTLRFRHDDMAEMLRHQARLFIIYDPINNDAKHADTIFSYSGHPIPIPVPLAGHPAGTFLRDAGLLSKLITGILLDDPDALMNFRDQLRAARRTTATYWANLGYLNRHRRPNLANAAILKAVSLSPENANLRNLQGRILLSQGRDEEARDAISIADRIRNDRAKTIAARILYLNSRKNK